MTAESEVEAKLTELMEAMHASRGQGSGAVRLTQAEIDRLLHTVPATAAKAFQLAEASALDTAKVRTDLKILRDEFADVMRGDVSGERKGVLSRLTTAEDAAVANQRILVGTPGREAEGLVAKTAHSADRIATWVRIQWLLGGAVLGIALKILSDFVGKP